MRFPWQPGKNKGMLDISSVPDLDHGVVGVGVVVVGRRRERGENVEQIKKKKKQKPTERR